MERSATSIHVALLGPDGGLDEERVANTPEAVRSLVRRWPGRPVPRGAGLFACGVTPPYTTSAS